jgi:hypothetical protein
MSGCLQTEFIQKKMKVYSATLNALRHAYMLLNQARKTEDRDPGLLSSVE